MGKVEVMAIQLRCTSKSVEWYVGTRSSFRPVIASPMRHILLGADSSMLSTHKSTLHGGLLYECHHLCFSDCLVAGQVCELK